MTGTELAGICIGSSLLALGVVSTAAATVRLRRRSTSLLAFGLWTTLYGARMLAQQPPVRETIGGEAHLWSYVNTIITYAINVPITVFVGTLIGPDWRRVVRWLVVAAAGFALAATAIGIVTGNPNAAMTVNTWFVLTCLAFALAAAIHGEIGRAHV